MPLDALGNELLAELDRIQSQLRSDTEIQVRFHTSRLTAATRGALELIDEIELGGKPPSGRDVRALREDLIAAIAELDDLPGEVAHFRVPSGCFDRARAIGVDLRHHDELGVSRVDLSASYSHGPPAWYTVAVVGQPWLTGGGHDFEEAVVALARAILARPPRFLSPVLLSDERRLLRWLRAMTPTPTLEDD